MWCHYPQLVSHHVCHFLQGESYRQLDVKYQWGNTAEDCSKNDEARALLKRDTIEEHQQWFINPLGIMESGFQKDAGILRGTFATNLAVFGPGLGMLILGGQAFGHS